MIHSSLRQSVLLALLLVLVGHTSGCRRAQPPGDEEHAVPAPVKVARARHLPAAEWTSLLGVTQPAPQRSARISAPVEGQVRELLQAKDEAGKPVVEGSEVTRGQIIAQLDDRILRATRAKSVAMQADLAEQLRQAEIANELARIEVKRLENLTRGTNPSPLVSSIELDKAKLVLQDADSKLKASRERQVAGKEELKALDEQLELYTLRAPIAGRLGQVQVVPGQTLSVGAIVAEVTDLSEIDVLAYAPPAAAARIALGQQARLTAPGSADAPLDGSIVFVAVQAQPDTGNFPVKVRFPNKDRKVAANRVAQVQVQTRPEEERYLVPEAAVLEDQDPPAVVLVMDMKSEKHGDKEEKRGKAKTFHARLGIRDRARHLVEILALEDPEAKEKVAVAEAVFVIEGAGGLRDDDEVSVEEEEAGEHK